MKLFRRGPAELPKVLTPEERLQNAEKNRNARNRMIIGGIALIAVTVGIEIANGNQEARRYRHDQQQQESGHVSTVGEDVSEGAKEVAPYLPAYAGSALLIGAFVAQAGIKQEEKQAKLQSESFN